MKRYDMWYDGICEKDGGDYVLYADHVSAIEAANKERDQAVVKARKYGALSVMGLLMEWAQKLGGTICLGLTMDETTGQPTGATLDVFHGDGEKYGALVTGPDGEKIVPADLLQTDMLRNRLLNARDHLKMTESDDTALLMWCKREVNEFLRLIGETP